MVTGGEALRAKRDLKKEIKPGAEGWGGEGGGVTIGGEATSIGVRTQRYWVGE